MPDAAVVAPRLAADGDACYSDAQCASGVCEGPNCERPGRCAPAQRACTRDLRAYCGCDGKTFRASGTCPSRRYFAKGACPAAATGRPHGAPCLNSRQCASKICGGLGCTDDEPGHCFDPRRECTQALITLCGCDGKTVENPTGCPELRFASYGECPGDPLR